MENARTENSADCGQRRLNFLEGDGKPDLLLINLRTIGTHHCDQTVGEEAAQEIERLREALRDAATSLQTIADKAGRDEYLMTTDQVRGYANSRANVARAVLKQEADQ